MPLRQIEDEGLRRMDETVPVGPAHRDNQIIRVRKVLLLLRRWRANAWPLDSHPSSSHRDPSFENATSPAIKSSRIASRALR